VQQKHCGFSQERIGKDLARLKCNVIVDKLGCIKTERSKNNLLAVPEVKTFREYDDNAVRSL